MKNKIVGYLQGAIFMILILLPAAYAQTVPAVYPHPETLSAKPFIAAAYGLAWLIVLGFVVIIYIRNRRLQKQINDLLQQLSDKKL